MTLQPGRYGRPEVFEDREGPYAICIGATDLGALRRTPLSTQKGWGNHVRCGQQVRLPGGLAGAPALERTCEACGNVPPGLPEALHLLCDSSDRRCPAVMTRGDCVAYSRRGTSLHLCGAGHSSSVRFFRGVRSPEPGAFLRLVPA